MCGEKILDKSAVWRNRGSPPHVRGKDSCLDKFIECLGITPACAGKSFSLYFTPKCVRDHPRMCGEKNRKNLLCQPYQGSPPHVRGKGAAPIFGGMTSGITPACAGKSCSFRSAAALIWDHPRMCGEKRSKPGAGNRSRGSPPHVRGKVVKFRSYPLRYGITPACAGKRLWILRLVNI